MVKNCQNIKSLVSENRGIFLCIVLFFLVGIVLGSYTIYYMSDFNKMEIGNYFTNFLDSIKSGDVVYIKVLIQSIINIVPLIAIIILLGYTMIGAPLVLILDLFKGYVIGFTFSLLVTILGAKGVMLLFLALMLQNIIFIPCIILISIISVRQSLSKFKSGIGKETMSIQICNSSYLKVQMVLSVILVVGILIETYISPNLIKIVINR